MNYKKRYKGTLFSEPAIRRAVAKFDEVFADGRGLDAKASSMSVERGEGKWELDSEGEFFAAYGEARDKDDTATYARGLVDDKGDRIVFSPEFHLYYHNGGTDITVGPNSSRERESARQEILAVFQILDEHAEACRLPDLGPSVDEDTVQPVVFIGHGQGLAWRDLKDHLAEKHGYAVEAYEIGARAGHAVRDVLEEMLERSSFALLVLTKEDETADGGMRARQNVVHEAGLFQGKLGFSRAIVLLEDGTEEFSNIRGIEQIRFENIKETFGDVLATLRREFG